MEKSKLDPTDGMYEGVSSQNVYYCKQLLGETMYQLIKTQAYVDDNIHNCSKLIKMLESVVMVIVMRCATSAGIWSE